jgi:outer membrane protein assembly factor BamB
VFVQCDVLSNGFVAALNMAEWARNLAHAARRHGDLEHAQCLRRGAAAATGRQRLEAHGRLRSANGEEIWRMSGGGDCPVPTPVVWHGLIFMMSAHGPRSPIYAVRTDAVGDISLRGGAGTNQYVAWSVPRGGSYMETPLIYDD